MTIYFDMDGTIADLYGVENWLDYLINSDATPYKVAKPLINLNSLARVLNNKQKNQSTSLRELKAISRLLNGNSS